MSSASWSVIDPSLDTSLDNHSLFSTSHPTDMASASGMVPPGYVFGQDMSYPGGQSASQADSSVFAQRPATRDRNAFDLRPGTCYFSLVLVVLGVCFVCPTPMVDETMIEIVNRLLSYGDEGKVREFTAHDLAYFKSNYGIISSQTDAWVDFLRLMWSEQYRQLEWILHGLSHGFRHGADPTSGLDIELYKDTNVVSSRYLYIEGETLDLHSTDTPALRKILIDIIAEAVQCDVVRPNERVTDTWSNGAAPPTPDRRSRRRGAPKRSKFEPENNMPNFPLIRDQPGRHFPYTRERVANHVANMSFGQRLNVADRLGLRVHRAPPAQQLQYQLDPSLGPGPSGLAPPLQLGQRSVGAAFHYGQPARDDQPDPKRQRTHGGGGGGDMSMSALTGPGQQTFDHFHDTFNTSPRRLAITNRASASPNRLQLLERSRNSIVSMSPRTRPQLSSRGVGLASSQTPQNRSDSKKRDLTESNEGGDGRVALLASRTSLQLPSINEAFPVKSEFNMEVAGGSGGQMRGVDPMNLQLASMDGSGLGDFGGDVLS